MVALVMVAVAVGHENCDIGVVFVLDGTVMLLWHCYEKENYIVMMRVVVVVVVVHKDCDEDCGIGGAGIGLDGDGTEGIIHMRKRGLYSCEMK